MLLLAIAMIFSSAPASAKGPPFTLLMVTSDDCPHCRKWERDIGQTYDRAPQAQLAPLVRIHPDDPRLAGLKNRAYTPTFILVAKGRELARTVGYSEPQKFWAWLDKLLPPQKPKPGRPAHSLPPSDLTQTNPDGLNAVT